MIEALLAGLFGLLIGSFLNVCIYRWPRDLSVVRPRSFCPACEHPIDWYDNVPVLSFLLLRAQCRKCGKPIPLRYPIVELLTGAAFFWPVYVFGINAQAIKFCIFGAVMIALVFSDFEERILPDEFTIGGTVAGFLIAVFVPPGWQEVNGGFMQLLLPVRNPRVVSVAESVFSAVFCAGALWAVGALYERLRHREGLGFGDVKMVAMIGAFLGLQGALLTMIIGSVLGSVVGLGYILIARKEMSTYELPFGSFLGGSALVVASFGEVLLKWYGRLM